MSTETTLAALAIVISIGIYVGTRALELRLRRSDLIRSYTSEFHTSPQLQKMFMAVLYDRLELDDDFYGSERELELLHFLDHLNIVGNLCKNRVLKFSEILPTVIGYATIRAWDNRSVRHYLEHVRKHDHADGYAAVSGFPYFEWLGQRIAALKTAPAVPVDAG